MLLHLKTRPSEALLREYLPRVRESGDIVAIGGIAAPPRVCAFDLDATLVPCEFMDELAASRGLAHLTEELTALAMSGEMDFRSSYLRRLRILRGTSVSGIERLIARLPLAPGAVETASALRGAGCRTAIITGGYARQARAIGRRLGIDDIYATELEERDGKLTGRLASPLVDRDGKVAALEDHCARCGLAPADAVVVGDGANDLRMLSHAGLAILYTSMPRTAEAPRPLDAILDLVLKR